VEYALLTGIVAIVSALIGPPVLERMKGAYEARNTNMNAIAAPDEPRP
jgi:Flp pilus assembly pilin Flp